MYNTTVEIGWTIGPGGCLSINIVWTTELDAFQLIGIEDHNRRTIIIGNY